VKAFVPAIIILGACSGQSVGPDVVVQDLAKSLDEGHPEALWDALPVSYQADVNDIISTFAANMDKDLYDKGFGVANKLVSVLKNKKQFILAHPMIAGMTQGKANEETYASVVAVLESFTTSEISTLDGVAKLDVREFLKSTGGNLVDDVQTLSQLGPEDQPKLEKFSDIDVKVVKESGDNATIAITSDDKTEEVELVKVEGKWVPAEMAADWDANIEKAKKDLQNLSTEITAEQKTQAMMGMDMALSALSQLENASTQEEFNQALGGIMGMAMGGMGGPETMPEE
jgi:hypothetical protein